MPVWQYLWNHSPKFRKKSETEGFSCMLFIHESNIVDVSYFTVFKWQCTETDGSLRYTLNVCCYVLEGILSKAVVWYHDWHTFLRVLPSVIWPVEQLNFLICFALSLLDSNEVFSHQNVILQYGKIWMLSFHVLFLCECTKVIVSQS